MLSHASFDTEESEQNWQNEDEEQECLHAWLKEAGMTRENALRRDARKLWVGGKPALSYVAVIV